MLQKFKMTTFSAVLGLVGFMVFSAAPVFADAVEPTQENIQECKDMPWEKGEKKKKMKCFRELAKNNPFAGSYYEADYRGANSSTEIDEMYEDEFVICKGMTWGEEKGDKSAKANCFSGLAHEIFSCYATTRKLWSSGARNVSYRTCCGGVGASGQCQGGVIVETFAAPGGDCTKVRVEPATFESKLVEATTRGFCSPQPSDGS